MKNNPYLIALASGLIAAVAIKATPAFAEAQPSQMEVALVRTADLNLASEQGRRQLDQRLAQAAREVCGTASDVDISGKNDIRKCRDETLAAAIGKRDALLAAADRGALIAVTAAR